MPIRQPRETEPPGDLRIAEVRVYQRDLPVVNEAYRMGHGAVESLDSTIVELVTHDGLAGFGETCPVGPTYQPQHALGARAALAEIAPALIGHDARSIRAVAKLMDGALSGHAYAKAAVDLSLWDLVGKAYGMRVCDLLGGALRERVPSYYALGVCDPDEAVDRAVEKQAEGYGRLQIKLGGRPLEADVETIRKVSARLGPTVRLVADANRSWTSAQAITVSRLCDDVPVVLEQPCDTLEEIVAIRPHVRHPIFLDECVVNLRVLAGAIKDGLAQGFGLKVTRAGGLTNFRALRDVCDAYNVSHTCDDTWGGDLIAAACVHMAATVRPTLLEGVWIAAPYIQCHDDPEHPVKIDNGWIDVPAGPGLGVLPDVTDWPAPVAHYE